MGINWQAVEPMAFIEDPSLLDDMKAHMRELEAYKAGMVVEIHRRRHDELASERDAGARDERACIVARFIERSARIKAYAADSPDTDERDIAMVSARLDESAAEWIEKGCP